MLGKHDRCGFPTCSREWNDFCLGSAVRLDVQVEVTQAPWELAVRCGGGDDVAAQRRSASIPAAMRPKHIADQPKAAGSLREMGRSLRCDARATGVACDRTLCHCSKPPFVDARRPIDPHISTE